MRAAPLAHALLALALPLAGLALAPAPGAAQQPPRASTCNLVEEGDVRRVVEAGLPMIYITGPFLVRCEGGAQLRADHGVLNQLANELRLTGNVWFEDPEQTLTAEEAIYTSTIGRLYATGDVVFTNRAEGSVLRGPELEYYRAMPETPGREIAQVTAEQRPHLTLQPREQTADAEPLEIDADRIAIYGQDRLSAHGNVVIERSDLHATGGEAQYDGEAETLELRRDAVIRSSDYDLSGEVVHASLEAGEIQQIRARTEAHLSGEELDVRAPDLQLFFTGGLLTRAVGVGEPPVEGADDAAEGARGEADDAGSSLRRAVASSRTFRLEADSLEALLPGQQLDRVVAVGDARGESIDTTAVAGTEDAEAEPDAAVDELLADLELAAADTAAADTAAVADSAALAVIANDWIRGDTIIGFFEPSAAEVGDGSDTPPAVADAAPADTAVALRRLVAVGSAQSLYRMREGQDGRPGVNFLAGQRIELELRGGELEVAQVRGLRQGLYLTRTEAVPPAPEQQPRTTERGTG